MTPEEPKQWTGSPFEKESLRPIEPDSGAVLGFTKRYTEDGQGYSFVAINVGRLGWYLSGPKYAGQPMTWDDLLDFIGGPDEWALTGVVAAWHPLGAENYHTDCVPLEQA